MKLLRSSIILLIVAILAYGLLIPRLGFYWDDLPITWIRYQLGPDALTRYFSTNRPVWGVLHQITTHFIPQVPLYWQIFAIFWRWLGALVVYVIVDRLWKSRHHLSLGVALLFLVYPGFNQNWTAYLYSHFYIVLFFFLFSFLCTLLAMESPKRYWVWTGIGMLFSALNLWMMEYFYVLELARVGVIVVAIRDESLTLWERLKRTLKLWLPYLVVFALSVIFRLFIFNNRVYGMSLTGQLKSAPVETFRALTHSIFLTLRLVLKDAWLNMFMLPDIAINGSIIKSYYLVIAAGILIVTFGFVFMLHDASRSNRKSIRDMAWMIGLGTLAVLLSGWPFWLIGFVPSLAWPASRFTLPFVFGVSLIFGGIIGMIPWGKLRITLFVVLVAMATGKQYLTSVNYQQDWITQKDLFWQMTWRAPGIKPDTLVLLNEGALDYYADNSLSAALNWIYAPDNRSQNIEYLLFYPTTRLRNALPKLEPGLPIYYDYLAGEFNGNTSQTLVMYFAPPGCLRILDPEIERINGLIPEQSLMRFAARLSSPDLILKEPSAHMPDVYGPEPEQGFCYYFEKADLARQFGDWNMVVKLGEDAMKFEGHPFEPMEQFVFIEGYAHVGEWNRAIQLSGTSYRVSKDFVGPMLCQLWKRIETETTGGVERSDALSRVQNLFACGL